MYCYAGPVRLQEVEIYLAAPVNISEVRQLIISHQIAGQGCLRPHSNYCNPKYSICLGSHSYVNGQLEEQVGQCKKFMA